MVYSEIPNLESMSNPELPLDRIPVEQLQLSMKALGYLKRTQIYTLGDLANYSQEDLLILDRELGEEVLAALQQQFGMNLAVDCTDPI